RDQKCRFHSRFATIITNFTGINKCRISSAKMQLKCKRDHSACLASAVLEALLAVNNLKQ
ncbi:MAG: hypothetical protein ACI934_000500, partial [Pseudohongiellaceae bacterium]